MHEKKSLASIVEQVKYGREKREAIVNLQNMIRYRMQRNY